MKATKTTSSDAPTAGADARGPENPSPRASSAKPKGTSAKPKATKPASEAPRAPARGPAAKAPAKTARSSRGGAKGRASAPREHHDDDGDSEVVDAELVEGGGDDAEVIDAVDAEVVDVDADEGAIDGELDEDVEVTDEDLEKLPASSASAISRSDPLQAYMREIQRHRLLTPQEEQELTRKYVSLPDDDSKKVQVAARLVTANLRLVVKLAYEYRRAYKNIMDLIQEGNIGLMQAVKRFDPNRGVKLSSYAAWWIRAYMLRFILNNHRLVKLGTTQAQRKLFFNLHKEKARLISMGVDPTSEVIAERLGVDAKEVTEMGHRLGSADSSLDAPVGDAEGRSVSRIDIMPGSGVGPEALMERREIDAMVAERLIDFRTTLEGKELVIFDKRLAADEPLTLQELGDEFGVSRERVRQLEARLAGKLRKYLQAELGDAVGAD